MKECHLLRIRSKRRAAARKPVAAACCPKLRLEAPATGCASRVKAAGENTGHRGRRPLNVRDSPLDVMDRQTKLCTPPAHIRLRRARDDCDSRVRSEPSASRARARQSLVWGKRRGSEATRRAPDRMAGEQHPPSAGDPRARLLG